ncbi:MAG: glycosyltransferase family 2 protein [Patescibacteria group bacterium]
MRETSQLVSIGFPTYNGSLRIKRAIDSLLVQSYKNFEFIISDNASEDNTKEICLEYAKKDSRIKYFRQEKNIGLTKNFEFVFEQAVGQYFMWAADDDLWDADFISALKSALDKDKNCGVVMSSLDIVYDDGEPFKQVKFYGENDVSRMKPGALFDAVVIKKPAVHFFIHGLFRAELLKKLFWQPLPNILGADKILICEAALFMRFCSVPDILWFRTVHRESDIKRYSRDYSTVVFDKKAHSKHAWTMAVRLFGSPNITWQLKLFLLPAKIIFLVWAERKHLFREIFPWMFNLVKKI